MPNNAKVETGASVYVDDEASRDISRTRDAALDFIRAHGGSVDAKLYTNPAYAKHLRNKVDLLVMPFLLLCYSMNFLDKVLLNVSTTDEFRAILSANSMRKSWA